MGKQFQKIILMGTLPFLLGLSACSLTWDEPVYFEGEGPENSAETVELSDVIVEDTGLEADLSVPCSSEGENCEASDDYLTPSFTQTEAVKEDLTWADDTSISVSRPAGRRAVSVKDKQAAKVVPAPAAVVGAGMAGSEVALSEKKVSQVTAEKTKTEDKVLYTTVAIPEEIGTDKTTETTLTTTKIIKNPAPETEVEPAEIPEGMIPLKKTVTTITETTTKVKKEKPTPKDFSKMTLAEKVAYGEEIQEWEANSGQTLRGLLMLWGNRSGWTVVWKLDRDYQLEAGVVFKGTFVDISSALIRSFARATPAPIGTFHQGNRVLVISTQEDENER
ncbi:MAG: toxin co-regulated pilus biosynthesis Q family protein [Alphaproteobacteria bacterium]|nr:toxin co-regulated pilus biosynthesis Q family protein [Alphaproteobacteria bacterium]